MSKLLTTGASRFGGEACPRLELSEFVKPQNEKQFSLYIQALQECYGRDQSQVASYFQIAGIHGKPYVTWNEPKIEEINNGYCVHGTPLFAIWHRPYVVLFEQEIQKIALTIAKKYTVDKSAWLQAAESLRQPYWAWDAAATLTPPDVVIADQEVTIKMPPKAESKFVPNPFFYYVFPVDTDMAAMTDCPFQHDLRQVTTRNPNRQGQTNVTKLKRILKANDTVGKDILKQSRALSKHKNWESFSKALETVHDTVHGVVGGLGDEGVPAGNMNWTPYAAFDPIFWAHHAQIDRLAQIWYDENHLWYSSKADLKPFSNSQTTYWRSDSIVDPDPIFNYCYRHLSHTTAASTTQASLAAERSLRRQWKALIKAKKFELSGSFTVFVFCGKVPADSREWLADPCFAGIFTVFANPAPEKCLNCRDQADVVIDGFVQLNDALEAAGLNSLEPEAVKSFLKAEVNSKRVNLGWGISTGTGRILHGDHLLTLFPSLRIEIVCDRGNIVPIGAGGGYTSYPDITRGLPGGCRDD